MDHSPFVFLYTAKNPVEWTDISREKTIQACGIINYSVKENSALLYPAGVWSKNVNPVVSSIMITLNNLFENHELCPKHIYIQMDGCSGENKNMDTLIFWYVMVSLHIFASIALCFLPVGHTYEQVDAFFSWLKNHLKYSRKTLINIDDWFYTLQGPPSASFKTHSSSVDWFYSCWDIYSWLEGCYYSFAGIRKSNCFHISMPSKSAQFAVVKTLPYSLYYTSFFSAPFSPLHTFSHGWPSSLYPNPPIDYWDDLLTKLKHTIFYNDSEAQILANTFISSWFD